MFGEKIKIICKTMSPEEAWEHIVQKYHTYQTSYWSGIDIAQWVGDDAKLHEMYAAKRLTYSQFDEYKRHFFNNVFPKEKERIDKNTKRLQEVAPKILNDAADKLRPIMKELDIHIPTAVIIKTTFGGNGGTTLDNNVIVLRITQHFQRDSSKTLPHEFLHLILDNFIGDIWRENKFEGDAAWYFANESLVEFFQDKILNIKYDEIDKFSEDYLTMKSIKTNLRGIMAKMIADYQKAKASSGPNDSR